MKKILIIIILFFVTTYGKAQYTASNMNELRNMYVTTINQPPVPITYDTIPYIIPVFDSTSYYLIYDSKGKQVDKVTSVESWSIPSGGRASRDKFVNMQEYGLVGYKILKTDSTGTRGIKYLGSDRKTPIPKPYIVSRYEIPVDGFGVFKEL